MAYIVYNEAKLSTVDRRVTAYTAALGRRVVHTSRRTADRGFCSAADGRLQQRVHS